MTKTDTTCKATTRAGARCKNTAGPDGYCYHPSHGPSAGESSGLNARQRRFIEEYIVDLNATRAAERAGYSGDDNTLSSVGYRLLKKAEIAEAVEERLEQMAMSAEEATVRMARWGRGTLAHFIRVVERDEEDEPSRVVIDLTSDGARQHFHLIKRLKQTTKWTDNGLTSTLEIEIHDAKDAVKHILQAHGKVVDRVEHTIGTDAKELAWLLGVNIEGMDRRGGGDNG